jgi:hypothetical protein
MPLWTKARSGNGEQGSSNSVVITICIGKQVSGYGVQGEIFPFAFTVPSAPLCAAANISS